TAMTRPLFPTSVVGSMPRSTFVQDLINGNPPLSAERYEAEMSAAVRYIVAVQEHAGLDIVTDGEWRRKSYIGVIAELAHGFELIRAAGADIIQIDDPHLCLFVDPAVRAGHADADAAADFAADMVNAIVDGAKGATFAVHLCRRAGARVRGEAQFQGGYDPI